MFNSEFLRKNFIYLGLSAFSFSTSLVIFLTSLVMQDRITIYSLLAYVFGTIYGIIAAFKFKEYNENPDKTSLIKPIVFTFIAATLIAMPGLFSTASGGCFGFSNLSGSQIKQNK